VNPEQSNLSDFTATFTPPPPPPKKHTKKKNKTNKTKGEKEKN